MGYEIPSDSEFAAAAKTIQANPMSDAPSQDMISVGVKPQNWGSIPTTTTPTDLPTDQLMGHEPNSAPLPMANTGNEAFDKFITFVNEKVQMLSQGAVLETDPSFSSLNGALSKFEGILLSLTSQYEVLRYEATEAKDAYDDAYAQLYVSERDAVNSVDRPATKYLSAKEIDMLVVSKHREKLTELRTKTELLDHQLSTLRRLIDGWTSYSFVLNTLSKNVQTEVMANIRQNDDAGDNAYENGNQSGRSANPDIPY